MLRKVLHILLAFNILASTVGVTVMERACSMEGKRAVELAFGEVVACDNAPVDAPEVKSCCARAVHKPGRQELSGAACCDVKALGLQNETNAPLRFEEGKTIVSALQPMPVPTPALRLPVCLDARAHGTYVRGPAPPSGMAIRILHQSFRC